MRLAMAHPTTTVESDRETQSSDQIVPTCRRAGIVEREMEGELALYDAINQQVHILNPTATLVWRLCGDGHTFGMIREVMTDLYPEAAQRIEADLQTIIHALETVSLLTVQEV
jgi:hypothetical protein